MDQVEKTEKNRLDQIKDQAGQFANKAREGLNNLNDRTAAYQEGAKELLDSIGLYIKENPQRSAMIALGVGFIIGRLSKRGRRDD